MLHSVVAEHGPKLQELSDAMCYEPKFASVLSNFAALKKCTLNTLNSLMRVVDLSVARCARPTAASCQSSRLAAIIQLEI